MCNGWSLTAYICDDCYLIKNAIRLYGKDKIINLVKKEFNIKYIKTLNNDNMQLVRNDKEDEKLNPKKRPRCNSENLYMNKKDDDEKYYYKEINDDVIHELKDKLTKL